MSKYMVDAYKYRKRHWKKNAILSPFLRLSKPFRDKKLWVFGCWSGKKYDDNSKYFFEYVRECHPEIRAVWISRSKEVVERLVSEGKEAYLDSSKKAKQIMLKAGAAFYTNAIDDLSGTCYVYGAVVINLNHGAVALKTLFYRRQYRRGTIKYYLKRIYDFIKKDLIFDWFHYTYVTTVSEAAQNNSMEVFGKKDTRRFKITGLARNDMFFCDIWDQEPNPSFFSEQDHYILYLPTYRPYNNNVVKNLYDQMCLDEELNMLLDKKHYKVVFKLHPADNTSEEVDRVNNYIIFMDGTDMCSTQKLLSISDVLITDYSSCAVDFAIKKQPIIVYTPDLDMYSDHNGLSEYWYECMGKKALSSPSNVISKIKGILNGKNNVLEATDLINQLFLPDGEYKMSCPQIYKLVIKKLGI